MPAPRRRRALPALVLALAVTLAPLAAGCGTGQDGRFDAQSATPSPTCRQHQTQQPGTRYTGGEKSNPTNVLEMMRYYAANGAKAFCDGKPATATDERWTQLYRSLGGDPAHVPDRP